MFKNCYALDNSDALSKKRIQCRREGKVAGVNSRGPGPEKGPGKILLMQEICNHGAGWTLCCGLVLSQGIYFT